MSVLSTEVIRAVRSPASRLAIGLLAQSRYEQIIMPRTGIDLPRQLPYEKWLSIGRQLAAVSTSSAWCLGDWLAYGEDAYSGRYRDAIDQTSLDYQTLRNYAWVARRFSLSRRWETLSFAHHAEVAGLPDPEQDFWLRKAEEESWSRNKLRQEVRASLAERATGADQDAADGNHGDAPSTVGMRDAGAIGAGPQPAAVREALIQVELSPEQMQSCQIVAVRLGHSIEEWAAAALDQAARAELGPRNG
jgi:hypothetical protein